MAVTVSASRRRTAFMRPRGFGGISLEAEIRSLHAMAPAAAAQLPTLFAESVVKSCMRVLGESSGEALIRRIGDGRLTTPSEVYSRVDLLLHGGSEPLKRAIRRSFRVDVHRLYVVTMGLRVPLLTPTL